MITAFQGATTGLGAQGSIFSQVNNALGVITPANVTNPLEFWLAFLLILAILNTVLKRVSFFSEDSNRSARAMVSLIISFFAVTVVWVSPVLVYMSSTLAVTALILVAILAVASLAGVDLKSNTRLSGAVFIVAIIILFLGGGLFSHAFVPGASGSTGSELSGILSSLTTQYLGVLIVFGILIVGIAVAFSGVGKKG